MAEILDEMTPEIGSVTVVPGSGGVFDVEVDGQTVFSKKSEGRFPDDGEVVRLLKEG